MSTAYVYILSTDDGRLEVGYTDDIRRDIFARRQELPEAHNIKLVYYETTTDHLQAVDRYIELRRLPRARKIWLVKALNPMWDDLSSEWLWGRLSADD